MAARTRAAPSRASHKFTIAPSVSQPNALDEALAKARNDLVDARNANAALREQVERLDRLTRAGAAERETLRAELADTQKRLVEASRAMPPALRAALGEAAQSGLRAERAERALFGLAQRLGDLETQRIERENEDALTEGARHV